jgi:hypothetical protein
MGDNHLLTEHPCLYQFIMDDTTFVNCVKDMLMPLTNCCLGVMIIAPNVNEIGIWGKRRGKGQPIGLIPRLLELSYNFSGNPMSLTTHRNLLSFSLGKNLSPPQNMKNNDEPPNSWRYLLAGGMLTLLRSRILFGCGKSSKMLQNPASPVHWPEAGYSGTPPHSRRPGFPRTGRDLWYESFLLLLSLTKQVLSDVIVVYAPS